MVEIIPSINVLTFGEVQEQIAKVEPHVSWCHLDVTDGIFSKHLTWHDPRDMPLLKTKLKAEVHLMVEEPEKIISQWFVKPVRRVIVHLEAVKDPELIIKKCHDAGKEIGFAINPETPWESLRPWLGRVDIVQVLAVSPGPSGQAMAPDTLRKVRHLRAVCKDCIIEIDGGVTLGMASEAIAAGADILVAGSAIFHASNISKAIRALNSV